MGTHVIGTTHADWVAEQARTKQRKAEARLSSAVRQGKNLFLADDPRPTALDKDVDRLPMWEGDLLTKAQALWDAGRENWRAFDEQNRSHREAEHAKTQARQEAQEAAEAAEQAKARAELLKPAKTAFLASGGSRAEWEAQAPQIEADIRREQATRAVLDAPGGLTADQLRSQRHFNRRF